MPHPYASMWDMGVTGLVHLLYDCATGAESDADGRGDRAQRFRTKRREQWRSVWLGDVGLAPAGRQGDFDGLGMVHIKAKGGDEASLNGGPTPIARVRRPSYSRLAAPPAARPYSRLRTRLLTHDLARVEAIFSSSRVPSQRSNTLP
eukprot:scaffold26783_cov47-Phaeocystis_antarctica.AAC.1